MGRSFVLLSIMICTLYLSGQENLDSLSYEKYERIILDGEVSYLNKETNQIISQEKYNSLYSGFFPWQTNLTGNAVIDGNRLALGMLLGFVPSAKSTAVPMDNWDTSKVNPYKRIKQEPPYPIYFSSDEYFSPVDHEMVITSRFGRRRRGPHRGIDIDLVTGDNVRAVLPGKVRFVGYSRGHGKTIVIRHENNLETVYAHLSDYDVKVNQMVEGGQVIGKGGNTGRSRGSHLHLETRYNGISIHPEFLFDFENPRRIRGSELWITKAMTNPRHHSSYRKSKVEVLPTKDMAMASQKEEKKIYKVRKGDTLHGIASRNGLYVKDIISLNGISYNSILKIGQLLILKD